MLDQLIEMFTGKSVRITNSTSRPAIKEGICKTVQRVPDTENEFNMQLEDGSCYGFVAEIVTPNSTDGQLRAGAGGRRKIEVI